MKTLTEVQRLENALTMAEYAFDKSGLSQDNRRHDIIDNVRGILRPGGAIPRWDRIEYLIQELEFSTEYFNRKH